MNRLKTKTWTSFSVPSVMDVVSHWISPVSHWCWKRQCCYLSFLVLKLWLKRPQFQFDLQALSPRVGTSTITYKYPVTLHTKLLWTKQGYMWERSAVASYHYALYLNVLITSVLFCILISVCAFRALHLKKFLKWEFGSWWPLTKTSLAGVALFSYTGTD